MIRDGAFISMKQKIFQETFNPQPYDFGYNIQDEFGNNQYRQETGDQSGSVRGSYGYTDALGIYRKVKYIADANGFRAEVNSNEPGMKSESPAAASFLIEAPPNGFQAPTGPDGSRRFTPQRRFPSSGSVPNAAAAAASS